MAYKIRGRRLSNGIGTTEIITIVTVDDPIDAKQILGHLALQNTYYDLKIVETKAPEKEDK